MSDALEYLERSRIEELTGELSARGYRVTVEPRVRDRTHFDLIAEKEGQRIAIEVKAQPALRKQMKQILRLRELAREQGFKEFRLVVVPPPHETEVLVPGLEDKLLECIRANAPASLRALPQRVDPKKVGQVDITEIALEPGLVRLHGSAVLLAELTPPADSPGSEEEAWAADFPVRFRLGLDPSDLRIVKVEELAVDTASAS
jgi:hypothetical protein